MMILEYYIGLSYDFQLLKKIQLRYFINVRLMGRIRFFFLWSKMLFYDEDGKCQNKGVF